MVITAASPSGRVRGRLLDHVALAVGTTDGLFIVGDGRTDGPFFPGEAVSSFIEAGSRCLAGTVGRAGAGVRVSEDAPLSWPASAPADPPPARPLAFPPDTGSALARVWQLHNDCTADGTTTARIWAGTEPAALFRSDDGGRSFELVRSLWDHPSRPSWEPGEEGLCLHTVLTHPERPARIIVAISAVGVFRSDDGGASWQPRNSGIAASFLPGDAATGVPEFGQCVHKVAIDAGNPDVLWAQTHGGIYRSENAGDEWVDVGCSGEGAGVPADFGFPIVAHPVWPDTAYVFPLVSSEYPCNPQGKCRVYRTIDAGRSWEPLTAGLPQTDARMTVLRDAFTVGTENPFVLAFGTGSGEVYGSADGGDNWRLDAWNLPPVLSVRVLTEG
jgi:hypothetical protein